MSVSCIWFFNYKHTSQRCDCSLSMEGVPILGHDDRLGGVPNLGHDERRTTLGQEGRSRSGKARRSGGTEERPGGTEARMREGMEGLESV